MEPSYIIRFLGTSYQSIIFLFLVLHRLQAVATLLHEEGSSSFFPSISDKLFLFLSCRLKSLEPEFLVSTPERLLEIVALKGVDISGVSLLVCSCFLFSYTASVSLQFFYRF